MKPLTATDPETKSPDLIAQNTEPLKALFSEAFTEGKVDFEAKEVTARYVKGSKRK
jgi:adenine-specific DNA-methyltransferase